jgi:hypothetical protein
MENSHPKPQWKILTQNRNGKFSPKTENRNAKSPRHHPIRTSTIPLTYYKIAQASNGTVDDTPDPYVPYYENLSAAAVIGGVSVSVLVVMTLPQTLPLLLLI